MMKKLVFQAFALSIFIFSQAITAQTILSENSSQLINTNDFEKSKDQTWPGKDHVWYKIDKNLKLWASKDGKKWEHSKEGIWQDLEGKWIKIVDKKLWWSSDEGKIWAEVPEWQWQGTDKRWYKFDKTWSIWVKAS